MILFSAFMVRPSSYACAFSGVSCAGALLSPAVFKRYCLPILNEYADLLKSSGKIFLVHMCGKLKAFQPELAAARFDGLADISPLPTGNFTLDEAAAFAKELGLYARYQSVIVDETWSRSGDATNGYWQAYRSHYKWDVGLSVRDWRYVVRIANIDVSTLTKTGSGTNDSDLTNLMARAIERVPSLSMGRAAFYCNRTIKSFLRQQMVNKIASSTLTMENLAGKHVLSFDGIPVRRCDSILNTEDDI